MQQAVPTCESPSEEDLIRIRAVADYQFGPRAGEAMFPDNIGVVKSRKTKKIKAIFLGGKLLATLKPNDGFLALSIQGASLLVQALPIPRYRVAVIDDVNEYIRKGRNLFAKHVLRADPEIRPGEEVIITDSKDEVIAVGRAILNGLEMKRFKIGLAVKVRRGEDEAQDEEGD
ncbi:MAG: hypothetical protein LUP94_01005 [Candidatus Methanomethylicus sp.]|nr:hypothetical protein [Candidatus Methanomethylicus sp.]